MRSLPIFFACVSTCRYRLRRAATPTVSRSATGSSREFVTVAREATSPAFSLSQLLRSRWIDPTLCSREGARERAREDVVSRDLLSVDLHHRDALAVALLELADAVDLHLLQLEAEIAGEAHELRPRVLAQVACGPAIEHDLGSYGYSPRMTVASATRSTASPYAARRAWAPCRSRYAQVSANARLTIASSFAFTSVSFQKYSC